MLKNWMHAYDLFCKSHTQVQDNEEIIFTQVMPFPQSGHPCQALLCSPLFHSPVAE